MKPFKISRSAVRRYLLDRQGLRAPLKPSKATSILEVEKCIQELECIQLDPVSVIEKNQHLVLAARIPSYKPDYLNTLLADGGIFEYWANAMCAIPIEDYPLFKPIRETRYNKVKEELSTFHHVAKDLLTRLEKEGPLPSRAFKSESKVHGYWDQTPKTKETSHTLNLLLDAGIIRVVKRVGNERFFGITEHTLPKDIVNRAQTIDMETAQEGLINKYIRAYRMVDPRDSRFGWMKLTAKERRHEVDQRVKKGVLIPLEVMDIKRPYYLLAEDLDRLQELGQPIDDDHPQNRLTFLPPLDNLLWSRERLINLFDFDYKWEIYIPQSKRRYGPYAMPILFGEQFVGRLDPFLDRKESKLIVRLLQLEPPFKLTAAFKRQLKKALQSFAHFHHAQDIEMGQTDPPQLSLF